MRIGCRYQVGRQWLGLWGVAVGLVMALVPAAFAAASTAPARGARTARLGRVSGVGVSQTPAALRAAARSKLRARTSAVSSPVQQGELTASDAASDDQFGWSVAVSGSTAVVGAVGKNSFAGAVYVFVRRGSTWSQQAELTDPDGASNDSFGSSVAISGSTVLVGAPGVHSLKGAVYVFVRSGTTWKRQATLTEPHPAKGAAQFGFGALLYKSTAVVNAFNELSARSKAYVFVRSGSTWKPQATLTDPHPANNDGFAAGAIYGGTIAVGSKGAAYVFVRSGTTWKRQATLTLSRSAKDYLGAGAMYEGTILVVSGKEGRPGGTVHVFVRSGTTWKRQATLADPHPVTNDAFGSSVALNKSTALVGAPFVAPNPAFPPGAAYRFVRSGTTWSEHGELTASDGDSGNVFGSSLAISGSTAVVGASAQNSATGAAYVFTGI